jgi:hypothetical protein
MKVIIFLYFGKSRLIGTVVFVHWNHHCSCSLFLLNLADGVFVCGSYNFNSALIFDLVFVPGGSVLLLPRRLTAVVFVSLWFHLPPYYKLTSRLFRCRWSDYVVCVSSHSLDRSVISTHVVEVVRFCVQVVLFSRVDPLLWPGGSPISSFSSDQLIFFVWVVKD